MPLTVGPLASISLDLDDLWTYLRTHGDPEWASRPSYLQSFVPQVLDVLDEQEVKLTFFVVGADAALKRNRPLFREILQRGHELANHSFEHLPWLHRYTRSELEREVIHTHDILAQLTGRPPIGFRGPGYSWSRELLDILEQQGYLYDASTLPTHVGPVARAYYFWSSNLGRKERAERKALFGSLGDGMRPVKPYLWELTCGRTLLEIPVTTFPVLKVPFHLSYLQYIGRYSRQVALVYLRAALAACRLTGTAPSFLLHPLDLLGADQISELAFFPAMDRSAASKYELFRSVLGLYRRSFSLVPMSVHARALLAGPLLPLRKPGPIPLDTALTNEEQQCAAS